MSRDGLQAKIEFLPVALAALAFLATAAPAAGEETRVLWSDDCIKLPRTSHGPPEWDLCGFSGLAINDAGDRLLTTTFQGRVQLWGSRKQPIAEFPGSATHNDQLMFAGDRALFLDGKGNLVVLEGRTGAAIARFANMPRFGRLERVIDDKILISEAPPGEYYKRETLVVSLGDGAVLERAYTGELRYRFGTGWAAGVSTRRDGSGQWRGTLHLADPALTRIPLDRVCDPIGPRPQCVSSDRSAGGLDLFDVETRRWSRFDLGAPMAPTSFVEWAQADGRTFVMVCDLQEFGPGGHSESGYSCRILDPAGGRALHRFEAARFAFAGGAGPDGAPELRVAARPKEGQVFTLWRIAMDGRVETLGRFATQTSFSIDGPGGLVWTTGPSRRGELVARRGRARARLDGRFGQCAQRMVTWAPHRCRVSLDARRIAQLEDDGARRRILWGTINWRSPRRGR